MRYGKQLVESKALLWLLLLLHRLSVSHAQSCVRQYQLMATNQLVNITSENFPNAYPAGSNCAYRIIAPMDHVVVLNCRYELFPDNCRTERLYISRDGDFQFRDAETYCRAGYISRISHFRVMAVGLYSSSSSATIRGRLFCQAVARPQRCACGWSLATRIANGQAAAKHEYPSMVALRNIDSTQRIFCGGSIVSHRYIITAAHCTRQQSVASRIIAYVGDHDLSSTTESIYAAQYRIQTIINHPAYAATATGNDLNDIALLRTVLPIEWSRGVGPICLPLQQATESFAYLNVDVIGWGTLGFAAPKSNILQKVNLLTMDNRICQQQYNFTSISAAQICTYDSRGLGQDSCQYDSGGPVIVRQRQRQLLIAIISFGRTCGQRFSIGVNTRITAHLNWLWTQLRRDNVCA